MLVPRSLRSCSWAAPRVFARFPSSPTRGSARDRPSKPSVLDAGDLGFSRQSGCSFCGERVVRRGAVDDHGRLAGGGHEEIGHRHQRRASATGHYPVNDPHWVRAKLPAIWWGAPNCDPSIATQEDPHGRAAALNQATGRPSGAAGPPSNALRPPITSPSGRGQPVEVRRRRHRDRAHTGRKRLRDLRCNTCSTAASSSPAGSARARREAADGAHPAERRRAQPVARQAGALDIGAHGVRWPHVSTVDQPTTRVAARRYQPPNVGAALRAGRHPRRRPAHLLALLAAPSRSTPRKAGVWPLGIPRARCCAFDDRGHARDRGESRRDPGRRCRASAWIPTIGMGDLSQEFGKAISRASTSTRRCLDAMKKHRRHLQEAQGRGRPPACRCDERRAHSWRRLHLPDGRAHAQLRGAGQGPHAGEADVSPSLPHTLSRHAPRKRGIQ